MPARSFVVRTIRATTIVAHDGLIPRPLRWGGVLGLLPVPGPFDEVVLFVVGGLLWLFYRDRVVEAWRQAAPSGADSPSADQDCGDPRIGELPKLDRADSTIFQ